MYHSSYVLYRLVVIVIGWALPKSLVVAEELIWEGAHLQANYVFALVIRIIARFPDCPGVGVITRFVIAIVIFSCLYLHVFDMSFAVMSSAFGRWRCFRCDKLRSLIVDASS